MSLPRSFFDAPEARAVWVETQLVCSCKAMADGKGLQVLCVPLANCCCVGLQPCRWWVHESGRAAC